MKNSTLSRNEIISDLSEIAVRVLWEQSGECTPSDLVKHGATESDVVQYGIEVITDAKRIYQTIRAA